MCASCLGRLTAPAEERILRWATLGRLLEGVVSFLILWMAFYTLGQGLLALPSSFHDGTVWQVGLTEPE